MMNHRIFGVSRRWISESSSSMQAFKLAAPNNRVAGTKQHIFQACQLLIQSCLILDTKRGKDDFLSWLKNWPSKVAHPLVIKDGNPKSPIKWKFHLWIYEPGTSHWHVWWSVAVAFTKVYPVDSFNGFFQRWNQSKHTEEGRGWLIQ